MQVPTAYNLLNSMSDTNWLELCDDDTMSVHQYIGGWEHMYDAWNEGYIGQIVWQITISKSDGTSFGILFLDYEDGRFKQNGYLHPEDM